MQILFFSRQNSENFDILHTFLPLTIIKLSTLKNSPVVFAHSVHYSYYKRLCYGRGIARRACQ